MSARVSRGVVVIALAAAGVGGALGVLLARLGPAPARLAGAGPPGAIGPSAGDAAIARALRDDVRVLGDGVRAVQEHLRALDARVAALERAAASSRAEASASDAPAAAETPAIEAAVRRALEERETAEQRREARSLAVSLVDPSESTERVDALATILAGIARDVRAMQEELGEQLLVIDAERSAYEARRDSLRRSAIPALARLYDADRARELFNQAVGFADLQCSEDEAARILGE